MIYLLKFAEIIRTYVPDFRIILKEFPPAVLPIDKQQKPIDFRVAKCEENTVLSKSWILTNRKYWKRLALDQVIYSLN